MARVDQAPEDRDSTPLQVSVFLDCEECSATFEEVFTAPDGVFEMQDLIDQPTKDVQCPECGHRWTATAEIYCSHEDA